MSCYILTFNSKRIGQQVYGVSVCLFFLGLGAYNSFCVCSRCFFGFYALFTFMLRSCQALRMFLSLPLDLCDGFGLSYCLGSLQCAGMQSPTSSLTARDSPNKSRLCENRLTT